MARENADGFIPVKLDFNARAGEDRFYIYVITNREKEKTYVGISRNPVRRVNQQLKEKAELSQDYAKVAAADAARPNGERVFEYGIGNPEGYPSAFLGCIAEILYMRRLEQQGKHIYNQNKFGGHPELKDKRGAFEAIVKIVDPSIQGHPSDDNMAALEDSISEIRDFVVQTDGKDIINTVFLAEMDAAWDAYMEARQKRGFGRAVISLDKVNLPNYVPLRHVNDNTNRSPENEVLEI